MSDLPWTGHLNAAGGSIRHPADSDDWAIVLTATRTGTRYELAGKAGTEWTGHLDRVDGAWTGELHDPWGWTLALTAVVQGAGFVLTGVLGRVPEALRLGELDGDGVTARTLCVSAKTRVRRAKVSA